MLNLRAVYRLKAKCPKHPRYNPHAEVGGGPGAIKGNCQFCTALWDIVARDTALRAAVVRVADMMPRGPK